MASIGAKRVNGNLSLEMLMKMYVVCYSLKVIHNDYWKSTGRAGPLWDH